MARSYYDVWIDEQSARIVGEMRQLAARGVFGSDYALYVVPSDRAEPGQLHLGTCSPDGEMRAVVRFPAQGSRVMAVPYSHVRSLLWDACRSFPILPSEGEHAA